MKEQTTPSQKCPKCQNSIPAEATFCPICGEALTAAEVPTGPAPVSPSSEIKCPRCEKKYLPPIPNYCERCGYPLAQAATSAETDSQAAPAVHKPEPVGHPADAESVEDSTVGDPSSGWSPYKPDEPKPDGKAGIGKEALKGNNTKGNASIRKRKTTSILKIVIGVVFLGIVVFGILYVWNQIKSDPEKVVTVEACVPVSPDEKYEEANRLDLDGDLRRDSYFASGQEYSIASGATFKIPKGITLIIEPGARVKFGEGSKMVIEGTLLACGRSNRRILFTANTTTGTPGYWTGVEIRNADPDTMVGHANFEFGGRDNHAPLWIESSTVHIEDLKFDSNQWYPLSLDPNSFPKVRPPLVVENGLQGWEIRSGEMTTSQTWDAAQPYIIREHMTIAESGSLNISAGTTVKLLPNGAINVKGDLSAIGSSNDPVRFTSYNDGDKEGAPEPKPGDYVGLRFFSKEGSSLLEKVEIAYGGQGGHREVGCLWMQDADPVLINVRLSNCEGFAISTDIASNPSIEKLDLDNQDALRRWELRSSTLEGSLERNLEKWTTIDGEPLIPVVRGWVGITEKASLTIAPGYTMLFFEGDSGLWVGGSLIANGERKQSIVFTTVRDPAYSRIGGAQPGDWSGVYLKNNDSQHQTLGYLNIQYAGRKGSPCLRIENSSPVLENISISNCASYAVSSDINSQPVVNNMAIHENNQYDVWEIRESSVSESKSVQWGPLQGSNNTTIDYLVTGVIKVEQDASLRLSSGLTLKFTEGKGINAKGALLVDGTKKEPVVMTSWRDSSTVDDQSIPEAGDWVGVLLDGSPGTEISFLEIHYGGYVAGRIGCLNLVDSQPTITDLTISDCAYYPMTSDLASQPSVQNLVLEKNEPADEWAIRESELTTGEQRVWSHLLEAKSKEAVLRTVIGKLTIEERAGLSIAEGVIIKFKEDASLWVRGQLTIHGSARQPVILTSWRDAEFSGEAGAKPGDWFGLVLDGGGANSTIEGVQIRYAGGDKKPRGAIALVNASPKLNQVTISDSAWYPLSMDAISNPTLEKVALTNNLPSNAVEIRPEGLNGLGETVWSPWQDAEGKPLTRVVNGVLAVGPQASLRLSPNIVVKFTDNAGLDVQGNFFANQAIMTSLYDDEYGVNTGGISKGDKVWQGVVLHGRTLVQLQDTLIRYAQIGLRMNDAAPQLSSLQIKDSWEAALASDLISDPQFTGLIVENNAINGLLIMVDTLPEGTTRWDAIGNPGDQLVRVIRSPLRINSGSHLIIGPGVVVKFAQQASLIVEGQLEVGMPGMERVTFTALPDGSYGGNTDNLSQSAFRGAWIGLILNPNNTNVDVSLKNVSILYAMTAIDILNPINFEMLDLSIAESQLYGILCKIPIQVLFEDVGIEFSNNGLDYSGCLGD